MTRVEIHPHLWGYLIGLALSNVSKALADLDDDDKLKLTKGEIDTVVSNDGIKCSVDSRVQSLNLVSESGLYDLIMQSRKPEAKANTHSNYKGILNSST